MRNRTVISDPAVISEVLLDERADRKLAAEECGIDRHAKREPIYRSGAGHVSQRDTRTYGSDGSAMFCAMTASGTCRTSPSNCHSMEWANANDDTPPGANAAAAD